ncbi:MAG: alginate export family protein [Candidatus Omnitrophica bacterium]|nr:alginate export family protein [Candidatus Omnitrophota bacterium]MDD5352262.1 alginate export family protein [Candidatus Omnitrophota bacterium]MDD5549860.1 alginate export family protein [Candidatus Omnitrophota bacterium]
MQKKKVIFIRFLILIFILVSFLLHILSIDNRLWADAQNDEEKVKEEQKLLESETTKELERIAIKPAKKGETIAFRYGGWFNSIYRSYENLDNDKSTVDTIHNSWLNDMRLWFKFTLFDKYAAYFRIKNYYVSRSTDTGYTGIGDDYDGPHLDMGYITLNFNEKESPITATLGRQYVYIGRGIAYSATHDGVKITWKPSHLFIKSFFTLTKPNEDNIDISVPNYEKNGERTFMGTEISYLDIPHTIIYIYGLIQKDRNNQNTNTQNYDYNSRYFGIGLEGGIERNFGYWAEIIKETGKDFTDAQAVKLDKRNINALALDLGLKYYFRNRFKPKFEFEYAYGSGDNDRTMVDYTRGGGNRYGDDKNFLYFGNFYGGYALSPKLSNLKAWKIESSVVPFNGYKFLKDLVVGIKYWFYRKDKASGGIYDTDATLPHKDIGQELNLYFYWKIAKNKYWSCRYGIFFPGKSYPVATQTDTKYFYTGLTVTF